MKHFDDQFTQTQVDQFGQASAALLRQGTQSIPKHLKDRLYAARMKALSVRKPEKIRIQKQVLAGSSRNLTSGSNGLWDSVGWIAPLVVLVFGLIGIAQWQDDSRINDIAEVDAALLSDDVPPDAYADSGFMAFLKNGPLSESDSQSDLLRSK
ncbi:MULTISPECIES: DUF3619 family protein [unclassified Polynucleobacter]|uniref:DUF3619 family protein n=1 Tax=unclassified Polynucleobacter TaxID=2640945 RepID=UPI00092A2EC7|nr:MULTISPECIES: DUF3619 family protein [unclassified Polynucleobacter]MBU3563156.1 DUF3619 family protein [Polynucleobacter sp. Tro8-14-1]MBU3640496.1 DUF3619 family protein [Polynucleobacter sp. Fuers-14]MEA9567756.1 DUF3619 family protein [Polynucleobacter sp. AP-Nickl1-40-C4]OJI05925.1 hypothetical protein AOC28_03140 [Polynucleobacter sp. MWH-Adler-W8]